MIAILKTRLMHWKKHWIMLLFWLVLPLVATTIVLNITSVVKEDSNIPVGVVIEDQSAAANELLEAITSTEFIRVSKLDEAEARYQLKKHQLDSVFVIQEDYDSGIRHNNRNQLITSYQSNLSFAYTPVKETVLSYIQQETGRSKAVHTVQSLADHYQAGNHFTREKITEKAKEIQSGQDLLKTSFAFGDNTTKTEDRSQLMNVWGLWAIFTLLSTFLLFDWVIHEKHASVTSRFAFMRYSFKHYLLMNSIMYTALCFIVDLGTMFLFWMLFQEKISIGSLIVFRILLNTVAFLFASLFKQPFLYYTTAFAVTLVLAVGSGAIVPISGITDKWSWMEMLNPLQPFLGNGYWNVSSWIILILAVGWYCRKEDHHASR